MYDFWLMCWGKGCWFDFLLARSWEGLQEGLESWFVLSEVVREVEACLVCLLQNTEIGFAEKVGR